MEGANAPVDEAAEERKGGAGDLAKVRPARRPLCPHAMLSCCSRVLVLQPCSLRLVLAGATQRLQRAQPAGLRKRLRLGSWQLGTPPTSNRPAPGLQRQGVFFLLVAAEGLRTAPLLHAAALPCLYR